ncbi:carboxypeptidase-like regulatory domain-containing protein [Aestuariibaculum sediminum]|uniref:Carboxypeptidase-like regulatory domain-containing protein n=1 Tax=Aestuariibaculum sediminum TaxID=2770637 RepID=A0A8J6Q351_9FLAO|nr:carboxypeptidase-like regulatory domain-containing protein [Aestuariibaculum sediminum]MBD0833074.1 carboxypeptidase-like regulatory domain-containing protein [Aestuariibaculum sediminum]
MRNQIKLNVKTPCNEDFNSFPQTASGGFCSSCKQEVLDFTNMNPDDIADYINQEGTNNICGRFKQSQLKVYYKSKRKKTWLRILKVIGAACLSLYFGKLQAQAPKQAEVNTLKSKNMTQVQTKAITVKGRVLEENLPLPGVNVVLEGSTVGVATDFDGKFEFPEKLKAGDVLVFSYLGMNSKRVVIKDNNTNLKVELQVEMKACDAILMGKVATNQIYKPKRK